MVRESGNDIDVAELDDVFVRRDLFEGKYAPDLEQQRLFELETNGNQRWDSPGVTGQGGLYVNVKDEL